MFVIINVQNVLIKAGSEYWLLRVYIAWHIVCKRYTLNKNDIKIDFPDYSFICFIGD